MIELKDRTILGLKVTGLGLVLALKNLGTWLATMSFTNVREDPVLFAWLLLIYVLINVPSDLFLMNHATKEKEVK